MRPVKHATHSHRDAQEIFDIAIARLGEKEKAIPVVTTSEADKITLFVWAQDDGEWKNIDINHVPIATPRDVPSITNTWNWSRRVGLTAFDDTIAVVYKRGEPVPVGETPKPAVLMLDTYTLRDNGYPQRQLHVQVPMPTYFVELGLLGQFVAERPGFELWTGVDLKRRKLLIVTQTLGEHATDKGDNADLTLLIGDLDQLENENAWTSKRLDTGGYGLDVRNTGDQLILVYRNSPNALRLPMPFGGIDPLFSGLPNFELDAQQASDQFYSPLSVMVLQLESFSSTKFELPGGEHPRIQNVEPLFVVIDRPQLRIRFRIVRVEDRGEARIDWLLSGVDKLAFLFDDQDRVARGVLMSFREGDRPTFPRTSAPWVNAQDLTDLTLTALGAASIKSRFPIEPLKLERDRKGLYFDFLQKAPLFALLESRVRLDANFPQGTLTAMALESVVYDINHAQFGPPDVLRPDATGENAQFAPFERLSEQAGNILVMPSYLPDNTIGGSIVTDRDGIPYQFFSYIDLGDGGLRVIYDADLGPPNAPPPVEKPKSLEPDRVPGPGSGDERWIELDEAPDWRDAGVPRIMMPNDSLTSGLKTYTSAVHAQIESLLVAGLTKAALPPIEDDGWTDDQVNNIQTALNQLEIDVGAEPGVIFSDGQPRAFISMLPGTVVADADTIWEAGVEGSIVVDVEWRFTLIIDLFNPPTLTRTGNTIPVSLPLDGDWTIRATITLDDGTIRAFETVVTAEESLFRRTASVHREIANRELGPPINSLGSARLGTSTINLLQYELDFDVEPDELATHHINIKTLDKTDAQWRFRKNGTEQGLIDYRLRIGFECKDVRLRGLLDLLLKIESIKASFFYGRSFTPGVLMNDTRSVAPLSGAELSDDGLAVGQEGGSLVRLASAMTTRPYRNDRVTKESVKVKVSMLPQAAAASVVTLLIGLGAATAAATLVALIAALGVATAAAAAPIVGVVSAAAVIAATVAIFLFITFVVPPIVENAVEKSIGDGLVNDDTRESLEDARLLQFAGEGIAEAISRQVIDKAALDPAPLDRVGLDRYRQDLYQMIHVSEGRVRVLIRG